MSFQVLWGKKRWAFNESSLNILFYFRRRSSSRCTHKDIRTQTWFSITIIIRRIQRVQKDRARERERDGERERIKWLVASRYSVAVVSTIIPVFFSIIRLRVKDCRVAEPSLALREAEKATKQQTKRAIRQRRLEIRFWLEVNEIRWEQTSRISFSIRPVCVCVCVRGTKKNPSQQAADGRTQTEKKKKFTSETEMWQRVRVKLGRIFSNTRLAAAVKEDKRE